MIEEPKSGHDWHINEFGQIECHHCGFTPYKDELFGKCPREKEND